MPNLGPMEIVLILVVILLLFGFKKLPDAARSLGKSARVFKSEVSELKEEDRQREADKKERESGPGSTAAADDSRPRTDNESGPVS